MAVTSIAQLLGALAQYRLLAPDQIAAVSSTAPADPRALAKELLGRGWLTPYQINQLFRGCGRELLLGSYVLMEKVGEGGMGAVFKARNWKLGQIVALKLIRPERLGSADAVKRFRREIRAAAQLDHPNIVRALDADEVGGTHLFVMEYVDGTPLNQVVKERGPLPAAEACAHIRQAALGLHHAQERGLVHRDVKPHNLLLARDGVVKILDMGLARMAADPAAAESTMLTQEGQVMGTPDYMAPEQSLDAHRADIRSDLYSLGCTLYFLLAGQPPFPGGSLTHKLMAHQLSEPEPIEARRADAPAAVAALVRRLMAKDPARRFQTPADLAAALQDLLRGAPARVVPAPDASADRTVTTGGGNPFAGLDWDDSTTPSAVSAPPRRRRPLLLAGMACAVLLLGGLTLVMVLAMRSLLDPGRPTAGPAAAAPSTEPHPPTPQGEMEAALQALEDKAADPKITFADLAPDVQAFQAKYAGAPAAIKAAELLMKPPSPLDALDPANIPAKERFNWQPRELAAVLGGRRRRQWGNVTCVCESPDGKTLASGDSNGLIHLCKLPELEESLILRGHATGVQSLAFSTDGRYLVSGGTDYTAWIWDVRSGKETACCRGNTTHSYSVALSSDSQWLLTGRDAVGLVCFHTENSKKPPQFQGHEGGVLSVAFLAEDRRVLSVGQDGTVRLWDFVAGKELHQVKDQGAVVSPDSTRILSWNGEKGAIHYWQAETGRDLPSLETGTGNRCVVFSADGNYAISGGNDGALHYWDLETGKLVRTIGGDMLVVLRLSYLGGRRVLSGSSDKTVRVWSLEDGRQLRRLANMQQLDGVCYGARWAYQISDNAVRFWDVETGKEVQPLTGTPFQKVALSPDGKTLATLAADRTVSLWDAATGKTVHEPIPVPANPESTITPLVFSPDGRRLAVGTSANVILMIDVDSGQAVTLPRTGAVLGVAFSPQGDLLASVEGSDGVKLWDVARQQLKDAFAQGENPMSVVFTASGKQIVYYASHDNTIRYWDIAGAREAQSVVAPDGSGGSLGFDFKGNLLTRGPYGAFDLSPNRKTLAEIGPDGLTIQDLIGAKPIRKIRLPGPVLSVAFAPDGRHLATANGNGTVYILNLAGTTEPADKRPDGAAGRLGVPVHLENSIGMKLNLIPDGTFLMGSPEEEKYRLADEGPRHEIAVSRPFYLGAYEVTVGQFKAFVRETGHKTAAEVNGKGATHYKDGSNVVDPECTWRTPGFEQTDDHPVVCVSWNDAVAFCEWLSRKENRMYRLPTEAEWEYACRAGTDTAYFFGDDAGPLDEYAWTGKNASEKSHAVGLLKPNPWGLHDVLGNGWEWCLDAPRPYTPTPATDPRGPTTGDLRAIRGGSFHPQDGASYYRSAFRFPPLNRNDAFANQTFRVVLELK